MRVQRQRAAAGLAWGFRPWGLPTRPAGLAWSALPRELGFPPANTYVRRVQKERSLFDGQKRRRHEPSCDGRSYVSTGIRRTIVNYRTFVYINEGVAMGKKSATDDRGQEPLRQLDVIRPWAAREGVVLLDPEIDQGTSASQTNPLERPRFVAACERAKAAGADAIVVEVGDRFGRRGSMESAWAEYEMGLRYGLKLWRSDKALAQHGTMVARVTDTIHDEGAREWVDKHKAKVRSGMARAKAEGRPVGRPPKSLDGGADHARAAASR